MLISDMKKFILKIILFFFILIITDFLIGKGLNLAYHHAISGNTARYDYIYSKTKEDILVLGSSRALDNFVPDTIEKYMNMSCYNCGESASGIMLCYPRLNIIKERYTPKIIIYDLYYEDLIQSSELRSLKTLKPYYNDKNVSEMYERIDPTLRLKMLSSLYKYNSEFIDYIADNIHHTNYFKKGQYVLGHTVSDRNVNVQSMESIKVDSVKLYYFEKLIKENKDKMSIYFTVSPSYKNKDGKLFKPIITICHKYNMPVFNHYSDTTFSSHYEYFMDPYHLNMTGAAKFTQTIAKEIADYRASVASYPYKHK